MKTGTACNRVTTQEECTLAAKKLGLAVTYNSGQITVDSRYNRVPYCWYAENFQHLIYNTNDGSSIACGEFNAQWWCICRTTNSTTAIRSFSVGKIRFFFMGTFPNVVYFQLLKECPNKCQTNFEQLETTLQTKEVLKKKFRFYRRKIRQ